MVVPINLNTGSICNASVGMRDMKRVLVTMASGTLANGVMRGLRAGDSSIHIIGVDSSRFHILQSNADELHMVPRANDPRYIDVMTQIATETEADFIWPMHDAEILRLSAAREELPCRTWVPPVGVCEISRDKLATNKVLEKAGIPVAETELLESHEDLKSAFDRFGGQVWLRARSGAGGKGAFKATNLEHANFWMEINDGWGTFTASAVLKGPGDYGWESLWKNGELVAGQVQTRLVKGYVGVSLTGVKNRAVLWRNAPDAVGEISERAVRAIMPEPDGMFRVDLFDDADGVPNVTEVDAGRLGSGGVAYWHELGYNFAYEALKLAFDVPVEYKIPVINPFPADTCSIAGANRDISFLTMSDADAIGAELDRRL